MLCSIGLMAQNTVIQENFNEWPLENWTHYNTNLPASEWGPCYQNDCAFEGSSAYQYLCNDGCDKWLISPAVYIENDGVNLSFMERFEENSIQWFGACEVKISTGSNDPLDGDFTALYTHVVDILPIEWTENTIDLSAYVGEEVYIAFHWQGTWTEWFIDNFEVAPEAFTDIAISELTAPVGTNPDAGIETIETVVTNTGTSNISDFEIEWSINGDNQPAFIASGIDMAPGTSMNVTLGSFDFSAAGAYALQGSILTENDFNPANNGFSSIFYNQPPVDVALVKTLPEEGTPEIGEVPIKVKIENVGENTVQFVDVNWTLNGVDQEAQSFSDLNLLPGTFTILQIGSAVLESGQHDIQASIESPADINSANDSYESVIPVGVLWESFEGVQYPPEEWITNWSIQEYILPAPHGDRYFGGTSDDNYFGIARDTLYTPYLDVEGTDVLTYYRRVNPVFIGSLDILWLPYGSDEVEVIASNITSEINIWDFITVPLESVSGVGRIGFAIYSNSYGEQNIDIIGSTASIHQFDKDILIKDFRPDYWAKTGQPKVLQAQIKNRGTSPITSDEYTIDLRLDNGTLLQSYPGIDLGVWETEVVNLPYQFTMEMQYNVYLEVNYGGDQNLENNRTLTYPISGLPNEISFIEVGTMDSPNLNFPFDFSGNGWTYSTKDVSQSIYYQDELQTAGYVYGITYHYRNIYSVNQHIPLKVWVAQTNANEFADGWHDQSDLVLLFDDTVRIDPGEVNELYIPFDEPVLFTNMGNLLFQHYTDYPEWPPAFGGFYSTFDDGPVRTARLMNSPESHYDPLPPYVGLDTDYSYVDFVVLPISNLTALTGTVYDENSIEMEGAEVTLAGQINSEFTNAQGAYEFENLPVTTYEVTATAYGYNDDTQTIALSPENQVLDFYLELRPQIDLNGIVVGSNDPEMGLENVLISVTGYDEFEMNSDNAGAFGMEDVYGNTSYTLTFTKYGYHELAIEIDVTEENYDLGIVEMTQESISAYNVIAVQNDTDALVEWMEPTTSEKQKLMNDADQATFSYANEINENVWLGNKFAIEELSTLQSVEVYWDYYPLEIGEVTLDVFDENGELLCTSLPFDTALDTLMEVNMPNILLGGDVYIMVHWQDNPATTHALRIDQTEGSLNSAYIKYPGDDFQLLSSYLGVEPGSFQLRANILKEGEGQGVPPIGYNIFSGPADELNDVDSWPQLNSGLLSETEFTDAPEQTGVIVYAVEAVYEEENAEVSYSNKLDFVLETEEVVQLENLQVYPNPTTDNVTVSFNLNQSEQVRLSLKNTLGQNVLEISPIEKSVINQQIDLSDLTPGYYVMEIQIGQTIHSEPLIKQ